MIEPPIRSSGSDPIPDPSTDSDSGLPRTNGRTNGEEGEQMRDQLSERNARDDAKPGVCGIRKPGGTTTCIEPAGHAGADGKGESHGDGSIIRWIYR